MYYTYMIRCYDNSIYTGITTDIKRRFQEHTSQGEKSAKYTRIRKVKCIEAIWESKDRATASKLEYRIKRLSKAQKESLIINNDFSVFKDYIEKDEYKRRSDVS